MLHGLARIEAWAWAAASRVLPMWARRLDHRLLLSRPYLWRSRLPAVIWFSVPVTLLAIAACFRTEMGAANAPTLAELAAAMAVPAYLVVIAIGYWMRMVMRFPVGPLRLGAFLRAMLFNFAAVVLILAPAYVYYVGLSYRIAQSIPDREFQEELAYLEERRFGLCSPALATMDEAEHDRLLASFRRFGMSGKGLALQPCSEEASPWALLPPMGYDCRADKCRRVPEARELHARLMSIRFHKAAWARFNLNPFADLDEANVRMFIGLALVAVVASAVTLAKMPSRPLRGGSIRARMRAAFRLPARAQTAFPRVGMIRRIDRRLLIRDPVLWATRAHSYVLASLVALGVGIVLAPALAGDSILLAGVYAFFVISLPLWLISSRRYRTVPVNARQIRSLLKGNLAGAAAIAVAATLLLVFAVPGRITLEGIAAWAAIFMLVMQLAITSRILFDLTEGAVRDLMLIGIVPLTLIGMVLALEAPGVVAAVVVVAVAAILLIDLKLKRIFAAGARAVAIIVLVVMPYIPIGLFVLLAYPARDLLASWDTTTAVLVSGAVYLLLMFSTFYWGLIPAVRTLCRARQQPAAR